MFLIHRTPYNRQVWNRRPSFPEISNGSEILKILMKKIFNGQKWFLIVDSRKFQNIFRPIWTLWNIFLRHERTFETPGNDSLLFHTWRLYGVLCIKNIFSRSQMISKYFWRIFQTINKKWFLNPKKIFYRNFWHFGDVRYWWKW